MDWVDFAVFFVIVLCVVWLISILIREPNSDAKVSVNKVNRSTKADVLDEEAPLYENRRPSCHCPCEYGCYMRGRRL